MRIAVVGAGVIGVTTAFELANDGHDVTVYERRGSIAAEASFANAGFVAPGYVTPWAAPGMPAKVLRGLTHAHAPVRLAGAPGLGLARWMWRWWRACDATGWRERRAALFGLARYSQFRLHVLQRALALDFDRAQGVLVLLRERRDEALARPGFDLLRELGVDARWLDESACRVIEPGLNPDSVFRAGIHTPGDEVGNCRQFTLQLREQAQTLGARFRLHHTVRDVRVDADGVRLALDPHDAGIVSRFGEAPDDAVEPGDASEARFDAVVICAGVGSLSILRPLRAAIPLAPVYGYSITAPLREHADPHLRVAPHSAIMDEAYKVAISRLGDRLRVAGSAELGGDASRLSPKPLDTLFKVLHDWFPAAADRSLVTPWKGARPMLPDGPPLIGALRADARVWVNLGHGSSGWALACGSARLLADRLAGKTPAIDGAPFLPERFGMA